MGRFDGLTGVTLDPVVVVWELTVGEAGVVGWVVTVAVLLGSASGA